MNHNTTNKSIGPSIILPNGQESNTTTESVQQQNSSIHEDGTYQRMTASFIEKYTREEIQELIATQSSSWLLSTEDFKLTIDLPPGLISESGQSDVDMEKGVVFLLPVLGIKKQAEFQSSSPENANTLNFLKGVTAKISKNVSTNIETFDLREIHQIIRELTIGIYVCNQTPSIQLQAAFDKSTICSIPPAYYDTRVGKILTNVDYTMKSLWHGSFFPLDKRIKFTERWRKSLDVNKYGISEASQSKMSEFKTAGLVDISLEPEYKNAFDMLFDMTDMPVEGIDDDMDFFMDHVDHVSVMMSFYQNKVKRLKNVYMIDPAWNIDSKINLDMQDLSELTYNRLNSRLQLETHFLNNHICDKKTISHDIHLLSLISFLIPCLIHFRRLHYIPNTSTLLPEMHADDLKTERELPPLAIDDDFRIKNFKYSRDEYFSLHGGIQFDIETPDLSSLNYKKYCEKIDSVVKSSNEFNDHLHDSQFQHQENTNLPVVEVDGKLYYYFKIDMEKCSMQVPQKPRWVNVMSEELVKLRKKNFPMEDGHIYEVLKKHVGYNKNYNLKNLNVGLKISACRGIVSVFDAISHKLSTGRISKMDDNGFNSMHYSNMYNHSTIVTKQIVISMDTNIKRNTGYAADGATPLHLACGSGSLSCVSCLLSNCANILINDNRGWTPIHYAAYYNNVSVCRMLLRSMDSLLDMHTNNSHKYTPLLLAATSGSLSSCEMLIECNANIMAVDTNKDGIVQLAALNIHTSIISLVMEKAGSSINIWKVLVSMFDSDIERRIMSAAKCMEVLSVEYENSWQELIHYIEQLVQLLKHRNVEIATIAMSVIKNISFESKVIKKISETNISSSLMHLLTYDNELLLSRTAAVLGDLASTKDNREKFANDGAVTLLTKLLSSDVEEVLINVVVAIKKMSIDNIENQNAFVEHDVISPLIEFLDASYENLHSDVSLCIAQLTRNNKVNQNKFLKQNIIEPIIFLLSKSHNMKTQVNLAIAIEALAYKNYESQVKFLECDSPKYLLQMMKKWSIEMKERSALAIWALSGNTLTQKKDIAMRIGFQQLIDMTLSSSEVLHYISCLAMDSLAYGDTDKQNSISEYGGIQPIVRLLKTHQNGSNRVLSSVITLIGTLCVGVAHRSNQHTQNKIAGENTISILVDMLSNCSNPDVDIDISNTLACIVLNNQKNQNLLISGTNFNFLYLLKMTQKPIEETRLKAGLALSNFAFNNIKLQSTILAMGGIPLSNFVPFLQSTNLIHKCYCAFQVVVLARVIHGANQIDITALGLRILVDLLKTDDRTVIITSARLLSSLEHTRAGIIDAILTLGVFNHLIPKLVSDDEQIRSSCAICLGYMTYNRTAARKLLSFCRNNNRLYKKIVDNIGPNAKISNWFLSQYEIAKKLGIPKISLHESLDIRTISNMKEKRPITCYIKKSANQRKSTANKDGNKKRFVKSAPGIKMNRPKFNVTDYS